MRFNDGLCLAELKGRETRNSGYRNFWAEPEFCLTVRVRHVYVDSGFFAREEEQPELTVANDRGCHERNVAETGEGGSVHELSSADTSLRSVLLNRSPFSGRHEARRALSTDGRFGRLRRTGNRPSVGNAVPRKREGLLFGFDPGAPAPLEFRRRDVADR